jgi:phosphoglycerate kinase
LRKSLAALADVYVNDAFGAAHRAHAVVEAIVRILTEAGAGLLMEEELKYLGQVLEHPDRPFVAILGGAKVSDKIEVIENLIPRVDRLIIGGAMAYTFFKSMGKPVGKSLVEDDKLDAARDIVARAKQRGLSLLLPSITWSRQSSRRACPPRRSPLTATQSAIAWGSISVHRPQGRMLTP